MNNIKNSRNQFWQKPINIREFGRKWQYLRLSAFAVGAILGPTHIMALSGYNLFQIPIIALNIVGLLYILAVCALGLAVLWKHYKTCDEAKPTC